MNDSGSTAGRWQPLVSLVIPCRNEADSIPTVLESLRRQDYPAELTEIIVVDGMSSDGTLAAVTDRRIRVILNPERTTPAGLNLGIRHARGEVIFTLGAHTRYSRNYISGALAAMERYGVDAVGSVARTLPGADTAVARAIALALSSRFGVGGSRMRVGTRCAALADTASCPAYRRSVFERIGLFDERLTRNQDIEFNLRLRRAGLRLLLEPKIRSYYLARRSLSGLCRSAFANGFWVVESLRYSLRAFRPRHLVPGLVTLASLLLISLSALSPVPSLVLAGLVALYIVADILFSIRAAMARPSRGRNNWVPVPLLFFIFPFLHLSYGLGSLWSLVTILPRRWAANRRFGRQAGHSRSLHLPLKESNVF